MSKTAGSANRFSIAALLLTLLTTACASEPSNRRKIVALDLATIVDVESTYAVLNRCFTCSEGNPIMRTPMRRGRVTAYAVQFGINNLAMLMAERADQNPNPNSFWHYLPYALMASHSVAGTMNLHMLTHVDNPAHFLPARNVVVDIAGWTPQTGPEVRHP